MLSRSVVPNSARPCELQPTRLPCPWGFSRQEHWSGLPCHEVPLNSPGKSLRFIRCNHSRALMPTGKEEGKEGRFLNITEHIDNKPCRLMIPSHPQIIKGGAVWSGVEISQRPPASCPRSLPHAAPCSPQQLVGSHNVYI